MILEEDKRFARAMLGDDAVNEAEKNAVLIHYGVKGMKWGIRRKRYREEKKKRLSWKRNRRFLEDKELSSAINRLESEKKLKNLVDEDVHPVATSAKKALKNIARSIGIAGLGAGAAYGIRTLVKGIKKNNEPGIVPYGTKVPKYSFDVNEVKKSFDALDFLKEVVAKKKK